MLVAKRKPEKLKPLKTLRNSAPDVPAKYALMTLLEEVMVYIEKIVSAAASKKYMEIVSLTPLLLNKLRNHGLHLDESYADELNNAYCELRNCALLEEVGVDGRLCLLYMIELRAGGWHQPPDFASYFSSRPLPLHEIEVAESVGGGGGASGGAAASQAVLLLNPGEVLKESGKFGSPTRMPGKTYCKDEVVIRNADSGKVMGIRGRRVHMIEELSETVISFQRVNPGAKERLVQITGPSEDNIELAKQLMESTIRRNASPVREEQPRQAAELCGSNSSLNSSTSDETNSRLLSNSIGGRMKKKGGHNLETGQFEYKHSVDSTEGTIHLSSHNLNLLKNAKIILDEHLANENKSEPTAPNLVAEKVAKSEPSQESLHQLQASPQPGVSQPHLSTLQQSLLQQQQSVPQSTTQTCLHQAQPTAMTQQIVLQPQTTPQQSVQLSGGVPPQKEVKLKTKPIVNGGSPLIPLVVDKPKCEYSREFLLDCALCRGSLVQPAGWPALATQFPLIVKQLMVKFDPDLYKRRWAENEGNSVQVLSTEVYPDSD